MLWDLDYYGLSQVDKEMYSFGAYFPTIFFILVGIIGLGMLGFIIWVIVALLRFFGVV